MPINKSNIFLCAFRLQSGAVIGLPDQKHLIEILAFCKIRHRIDQVTDFPVDESFRFLDAMDQECLVNIAHEDQIQNFIVDASGHIARQVDGLQVSQPFRNAFHHYIEADELPDNAVDLIVQRMSPVDLEQLFIAVQGRLQEVGLFKAVQLQADGVGRFAEFRFQTPQIRTVFGIKKEF